MAAGAAETAREPSRIAALWRRLRGGQSPLATGFSVAIGLFVGCLPLFGLHLPLCLLVCVPLRLDAPLAYLAANISNPLVAPFLLLLELEVGARLTSGAWLGLSVDAVRSTGVGGLVTQAAVGSVVVGLALGLLGGVFSAAVAARALARRGARDGAPEEERELAARERALRATQARYGGAPRGDRIYVAIKLRADPVLAQVAALGPLGEVLDLGAGRGQLALCLLELGRVARLRGVDLDARKIALADGAARGEAEFAVADVREYALAPADTILLVDVLHYLAPDEQDALLARAARAVRPGGRLVIRELDDGPGLRRAFTRTAERVATRLGYNRLRGALGFRPFAQIVARSAELGLDVRTAGASAGTPFDNRLLIATRPAEGGRPE